MTYIIYVDSETDMAYVPCVDCGKATPVEIRGAENRKPWCKQCNDAAVGRVGFKPGETYFHSTDEERPSEMTSQEMLAKQRKGQRIWRVPKGDELEFEPVTEWEEMGDGSLMGEIGEEIKRARSARQ